MEVRSSVTRRGDYTDDPCTQVWDGISDARISFSTSQLALGGPEDDGMARLTENLNIQRGLLRSLSAMPAVELADNVKVSSIQREEREGGGWPLVHLSNGRTLRARLLVRPTPVETMLLRA
jgi:ubiquinone biosynthesis monooxygenase Coq6